MHLRRDDIQTYLHGVSKNLSSCNSTGSGSTDSAASTTSPGPDHVPAQQQSPPRSVSESQLSGNSTDITLQGAASQSNTTCPSYPQEHTTPMTTNQQQDFCISPPSSTLDGTATTRQLQMSTREYPQRRGKYDEGVSKLRPATISSFVAGIWKQIYNGIEVYPISMVRGRVSTILKTR